MGIYLIFISFYLCHFFLPGAQPVVASKDSKTFQGPSSISVHIKHAQVLLPILLLNTALFFPWKPRSPLQILIHKVFGPSGRQGNEVFLCLSNSKYDARRHQQSGSKIFMLFSFTSTEKKGELMCFNVFTELVLRPAIPEAIYWKQENTTKNPQTKPPKRTPKL